MRHAAPADLSFAPCFRPFYLADLDGYTTVLDSLAYPGDLKVHGATPYLDLAACRLMSGGLAIRLATTPMQVRHTAEHICQPDDASVLVTFLMEGAGRLEQAGRVMDFGPGDITFRTTAQPSVITMLRPSRLMVLSVPVQRFFGAFDKLGRDFVPGRADARQALAMTARAHIDHVFPDLPSMQTSTAYFAEQALVALLAAAYCESVAAPEPGPDAEADRWLRLVAFIDANLGDASLSVDRIAAALKVSKRRIHRLFESRGQQYGTYLRRLRLQRARAELENDRLRHLSVTEIGLRNGFRDSSHFSRSFREHYGVPPSNHRQAAR